MRLFIVLVIACIPSMGMAQRVTVRSGEHADFSRLAFEFSNLKKWKMGRVEHGYEIRLQGSSSEIDLSEVFQRIPRDRIKNLSVSQDNLRVTLELGCECYADAFEFRPGLLVVDVKDGTPPATSRFEAVFNSGELEEGQDVAVEKPKTSGEGAANTPVVTLPLRLSNVHSLTKPNVDLFAASAGGAMDEPRPQIVKMQDRIIRQIGRAASQGLLNANLPVSIQGPPNDHRVVNVIEERAAEPAAKPQVNIHIQSSIDREFASLARQNMLTGNGTKCLSDSLFNIAEWGDEDSILARISEQRSLILSEFDTVEVHEVTALAKAYIYAGFGAEALEVISAFDVTLEGKRILKIMAHIVDGTKPKDHAAFTGQISCDSASAMWAALSTPDLSALGQINSIPILGNFSGLPAHLRRLLGPGLAKKFLDFGDVETARGLRNSIARASGESGPEFHFLEVQLDLERGHNESAEQVLEDMLVEDSDLAPKALIQLLELKLQNREDIDTKTLATAESYIFEQQNTKIAVDLKRLTVLALGQAGDFLSALDALNELENFELLEEHQKSLTWGKIIDGLAEDAMESVLLRFVFTAQDDLIHQNIPRVTRRKLASRLLKEGWPEKAEMILAAPTSPTADDRVILARAQVLKGNTDQVLSLLENMAGDEAAQIRALAYERLGNYLAEAQEYKLLKDEKNQKNAAWRARDWQQLAVIGTEVDQAAAKIMLPQNYGELPAAIGTIGLDFSLLTKSEVERESIEKLLKEYPFLLEEKV